MSRRIRSVRVTARAKINLGLAVGPLRTDGFHEIVTVYQSVSLADTVLVRPRSSGFRLAIRHEDAALRMAPAGRGDLARSRAGAGTGERLPLGRDNLVLRAAHLLQRRTGRVGGATFELIKRIPAGAGLGGGSADAAAALRGLARLYGLRVSPDRWRQWAAELGSDVPFALQGGTALGLGRGERLTPLRPIRPFRAVIAVPRWRVATARAYARIDRGTLVLTGYGAKLRIAQDIGRKGLSPMSHREIGNTFEHVLGARRRDFESLCRRLRDAGLEGPQMTGSGSAVFGFLGPGTTAMSVGRRFIGPERLYLVRSTRSGLRINIHR
jgi:4-diphosphocytidyl-2-C-methyl-D-erythritol kinase